MLIRIVPVLAALALHAMPVAAQVSREQTPAPAPGSALQTDSPVGPQEARTFEVDDRRWMAAFEQELAEAEINRPRWLFPAAGAVLGGVAGVGYSGEVLRSDFMGPISPYYVLVPLGALVGGLVGWYVDAAQRQWVATRPTPKQE
jgi:hypothetical protein